MNRKLPTLITLLVMMLVGAMYWADLHYYTDATTGFVLLGNVWQRYAILVLPLLMGVLGIHTLTPRALATLRVPSKPLGAVFLLAGIAGAAYGVVLLLDAFAPFAMWPFVLGLLFVWYGIWFVLCARQLAWQKTVSPTRSAVLGVLAALPFCALTVYRVLVQPTTLYRVGPFVKNFSALFAMLWFGVLLRAFYIALVKSRARWMYGIGIFTFLLATCLEMPLAIYSFIYNGAALTELLEGLALGSLGLVAGCVSVAIAGQALPKAELTA